MKIGLVVFMLFAITLTGFCQDLDSIQIKLPGHKNVGSLCIDDLLSIKEFEISKPGYTVVKFVVEIDIDGWFQTFHIDSCIFNSKLKNYLLRNKNHEVDIYIEDFIIKSKEGKEIRNETYLLYRLREKIILEEINERFFKI